MSRVRQILAAGGTFSVALGIGFVMQNGDALAERFGGDAPSPQTALSQPLPEAAPQAAAVELPAGEVVEVVEIVEVVQAAPAQPALAGEVVAGDVMSGFGQVTSTVSNAFSAVPVPFLRDPAPGRTAPDPLALAGYEAEPEEAPGLMVAAIGDAPLSGVDAPVEAMPVCSTTMTAEAAEAAMVRVLIDAPCAPGTLATLHHQGMIVSVLTDASGRAETFVPALTPEAVFLVDLGNGQGAAAVVSVPDLAMYDRAVLQWQGERGFALHAMEFGAGWNEPGHVWAGALGSEAAAMAGEGGFLTTLGAEGIDTAYRAEVYTYPSGQSVRSGVVALSVEAEVTTANCGREVTAQSIQVMAGEAPSALDLVMTMPGCEAAGEFLLLASMLDDLTLAAR